MCGRYTLTATPEELAAAFPNHTPPADYAPRFNIAPTQQVVVIPNDGQGQMQLFRWGLVPFWAKDPKIGSRMINARGETLPEKPAFRTAFKRRRCLILSDGFYEWQKQPDGKTKIPQYIRLASGQPFAFAGLWEVWRPDETASPLYSCTIITTAPNDLVATIHDRMPVILPRDAYTTWLHPDEVDPVSLMPLLTAYPASDMTVHPVSRKVNSPANDSPDLVLPLAA